MLAVVYNWIMANFIKTFFGFDFSKNSVNNVVKQTNEIKSAVISVGPVFQTLKDKVDKMSHVTFWVGISTSAEKAFGGVKSIVGSVAGDLKKIYGFADDYAKKGDKIAKTSRLVGLSVKDYQAFSSAAEDSGMAVEEMDSALKKFNINLAKARSGDKVMLANFSKALFGKDSNLKGLNDLKTNRDVIIALADSYSKVEKAEDKAFMSSELFGKSGLKMSEILSQGGKSVQSFLDSYDKGFTDDGAAKAEEFTHQLQMMREEFDGIKVSVAQELFPVFRELFKEITGMLKGENGSKLKTSLVDAGKSLKTFIEGVLPKIPRILNVVAKIVDMITPELAVGAGYLLSFIPAIGQIVLGCAGLWHLIRGIGAMIGVAFGWFLKIGGLLKVSFGLLLKISGVLLLKIGGALKIAFFYGRGLLLGARLLVGLIGGALLAKIALVTAGIMGWIYTFRTIYKNWDLLKSFVKDILDDFCDWISGFGKKISDFFMDKLHGLFGFVGRMRDAIHGLFSGFPDKVKSFFGLGDIDVNVNSSSSAQSTLAASAVQAISESRTTVTNRFAVDFNNVPRGTKITPPPKGDFDWSRGYVLGGI